MEMDLFPRYGAGKNQGHNMCSAMGNRYQDNTAERSTSNEVYGEIAELSPRRMAPTVTVPPLGFRGTSHDRKTAPSGGAVPAGDWAPVALRGNSAMSGPFYQPKGFLQTNRKRGSVRRVFIKEMDLLARYGAERNQGPSMCSAMWNRIQDNTEERSY